MKGKIVCVECHLQDARRTQSSKDQSQLYLYQVISKQGQLVMEVKSVSNPAWFDYVLAPHLWFRGDTEQLQKLSAPENLTKEVEISAFLTNPHTLDVREVILQQ
jgi:hypothetical protein